MDAHLTREELEGLVKPYLERTVSCLRRAIDSARLQPKDLVGIFLVGGSSRIPLAAHLIHTELGVAPTTLEQPETVVVEGALCIGAPSAPVRASGMPRTVTPPPPPQQQQPVSAVPVSPAMNRPGPVQQQPMQQGPPMQQRPPVQLVRQPPPPQHPPVQLIRQQPRPQQQPRPVQQQPVQQVRQQQPVQQPYRPPVSPAPVAQPARPGPFPPQVARPVQQQTDEGERNWVAVIIVVLILVAVLFVILLMTAFNG